MALPRVETFISSEELIRDSAPVTYLYRRHSNKQGTVPKQKVEDVPKYCFPDPGL